MTDKHLNANGGIADERSAPTQPDLFGGVANSEMAEATADATAATDDTAETAAAMASPSPLPPNPFVDLVRSLCRARGFEADEAATRPEHERHAEYRAIIAHVINGGR